MQKTVSENAQLKFSAAYRAGTQPIVRYCTESLKSTNVIQPSQAYPEVASLVILDFFKQTANINHHIG